MKEKKKSLKINIEDVPDDLSQLPEDTIIIFHDDDPMQDNAFWDEFEE